VWLGGGVDRPPGRDRGFAWSSTHRIRSVAGTVPSFKERDNGAITLPQRGDFFGINVLSSCEMLSARLTPHHTDIKRGPPIQPAFFPRQAASGFGVPASSRSGKGADQLRYLLRAALPSDWRPRPPKGGTPNAGSQIKPGPFRPQAAAGSESRLQPVGEGSRRIALSRSALLHRD